MNFLEISRQIGSKLENIPKIWDGKKAIMGMKEAGYAHWRQMEWMGFYFQFLCEKYLSGIMDIPGPKYGRVAFDGFKEIPWDFKARAIDTKRHDVIVNDSQATADAVKEYKQIGLILAQVNAVYNDENRTFQKWHENLKGGKSDYTTERIRRGAPSRIRKTSCELQRISYIRIADDTLVKCGSFQKGFRNADGSPRKPKVKINLRELDEIEVHSVAF